ncbi:helix-turn-helix domain-containing protein [Halomonas denitrificans]|nr:helix-turn-helix domain-containing protein [Halomonas denitrificans]
MIVRKLRLRKGWSQDQLAELADVSVRTIQRIERGHAPSLETANALAAVFEVDVTTFLPTPEPEHDAMTDPDRHTAEGSSTQSSSTDSSTTEPPKREHLEADEAEALEYAQNVSAFYTGVLSLVILAAVFFTAFGFDEPVLWVIFGGIVIGLGIQGLAAYEIIRFPFQNLEKKLAEKKLGRKL